MAVTNITRVTAGECTLVLELLNSYLGTEAPAFLRTQASTLPLLASEEFKNPSNVLRTKYHTRDPETGKLKKYTMQFDKRTLESEVSTTLTNGCTGDAPDYGDEFEVNPTYLTVEDNVRWLFSEWEEICANPQEAMPNLMRRIEKKVNAMIRKMDTDNIQRLVAGAGVAPGYSMGVGDTFNVNILNSDSSIDSGGVLRLMEMYAEMDLEFMPWCLADNKSAMARYIRLKESNANSSSDGGIDKKALAEQLEFNPMISPKVRTSHTELAGEDLAFFIQPGWVWFMQDYQNPEEGKQYANSYVGRWIDPRTGVEFDMIFKYIDCPDGATNGHPEIILTLQKSYYLFTLPTTGLFKVGDPMEGFNGIVKVWGGHCPTDACATSFAVTAQNAVFDPSTGAAPLDTTVTFDLTYPNGAIIESLVLTANDGAGNTFDATATYDTVNETWTATFSAATSNALTPAGTYVVTGVATFANASDSTTAIAIGSVVVS